MKKILRPVIFLLIALLWLSKVYDVLRWKDTHGDYLSSVTELQQTDEDLVDVIFVGSSHVYAGIYPSYLWADYGISAFDLSISGMDRDSAYYYMKHCFKTQSPKVAVVDLFSLTFDKHEHSGNVYRNYLSLPLSEDTLPALQAYGAKDPSVSENIADFVARWPIIHTRYRELSRPDFELDAPNYFARGEYLNWEINPNSPSYPGEYAPILFSDDQQKWLDDLRALCEESDCELVFMVLPFHTYDQDQNYIDTASYYASEYGINFFDFNRMTQELEIDYEHDFFDESHLNGYGAKKVSLFMGAWLDETFSLPDHRGDSNYDIWDEDQNYYLHRRDGDALAGTSAPDEFFPILSRMEGVSAVISLEGDLSTADYYSYLSMLGMPAEEYATGGKWIWQDGSIRKIMENDVAAPLYTEELDEYATLQIRYSGSADGSGNVRIDRSDYSNKGDVLRITVYDNFLHHVVTSRSF